MPYKDRDKARAARRRWYRAHHAPGSPKMGRQQAWTKRATAMPSQRLLGWAAGFLEGEGSFLRGHRVNATQVQEEPLHRLLAIFGGSVHLARGARGKHSACWRWEASGSRARGIMLTLYGLLSAKRHQQIRLALQS